jgi:exodeoxyribonuclease-3
MTRIFDELGLVDVHRGSRQRRRAVHLVEQPRPGVCEERRLAHRLPRRHPGHRRRAHAVSIYKDERFSDHAPLIIDYQS